MAWLLSITILFMGIYGVYRYGRHVEGIERDSIQSKAMIENAVNINEAIEQHEKDEIVIAGLRNKSSRVRVRISCPVPTSAADTNAASGVLSGDIQQAFDRFRQGTQSLIEQCDLLNLSARQSNSLQQR